MKILYIKQVRMSVEHNFQENNILPPRPQRLMLINPDDLMEESQSQQSEPQTPKPQTPKPQTPKPPRPKPQRPLEICIKGKFLYIKEMHTREMLVNAWNSITQLELWDYMKQDTYSYMMSNDKEIDRITKKMEELGYNCHSGCSFEWTMRQIQYIAQNGEDTYMKQIL
jgi:hypothetical protein